MFGVMTRVQGAAIPRRTTRVTPLFERDRAKAKADFDLTVSIPALRVFAIKIDRLACRSHASWETIVAAQLVRDAVIALERAVAADEGIAR